MLTRHRARPGRSKLLASLLAVAATLLLLEHRRAEAAEPPQTSSGQTEGLQRLREYYRRAPTGYRISSANASEVELRLQETALMNWISLDSFNGAVFVWTRQERPEIVGSIFSWAVADSQGRRVVHEFYSFSLHPLTMVAPTGDRWEVEPLQGLRPLPNTPPPAETARARRRQVRALAHRFSAHLNGRGRRWELRLLPQPLWAYESDSPEVLCGAVFAFVSYVTDPEVLLLIEARQTSAGPKWHYHPARFSDKSLWVEYDNKEVWKSLRRGHGTNDPDTPDPQFRAFQKGVITLK